ncbi:hypothetical protein [Microvirga sp. 17 mud 1-3]|uniref:hypothetical protein n=1 Tax=Microvirga sp. 17 mud 1-3 TaxID=2082949 RepID=UPI000D6AFBD2|nr:hypothetical protein [Microvirga sp. 17 mud 1-3]AWM88268.1 hypothetical protein C4E04_16975 [Microvirga sp. 17 mud 1-3]
MRSGVALRTVAEGFGVSKTALIRHRDNHMDTQVPRVRHRERPAALSAPLNVHEKMRRALWMREQGFTRSEIAEALTITEGYVSELFARARDEALAAVKEATAEQLVTDLRTTHALQMAKLAALYDQAEKVGDRKTMVAVLRERRHHNESLRELYRTLGAFDRFTRHSQSEPTNPLAKAAIDWMNEVADLFNGTGDMLDAVEP